MAQRDLPLSVSSPQRQVLLLNLGGQSTPQKVGVWEQESTLGWVGGQGIGVYLQVDRGLSVGGYQVLGRGLGGRGLPTSR